MQKRSLYRRKTQQTSLVQQLKSRLLLTTILFIVALAMRFVVGIYITNSERSIDTQTIKLNDTINSLTLFMIDQDTSMRSYISWGKAQDAEAILLGEIQGEEKSNYKSFTFQHFYLQSEAQMAIWESSMRE